MRATVNLTDRNDSSHDNRDSRYYDTIMCSARCFYPTTDYPADYRRRIGTDLITHALVQCARKLRKITEERAQKDRVNFACVL